MYIVHGDVRSKSRDAAANHDSCKGRFLVGFGRGSVVQRPRGLRKFNKLFFESIAALRYCVV